MTALLDFVAASVNQCIDLDGAYGCQCVDLVQYWAQRVGHPLPNVVGAKDFAGQSIAGWTWVANSPTNAPSPGDIIIWDSQIGPYGHTAVCVGPVDGMFFTSLDQNWINSSDLGSVAVHVEHSYYGVAGWFVLNSAGGSDVTPDQLKQAIREVLDEGTPAGGSSWRSGNIDTAHKVDVLFHQLGEAVATGQIDAKGTVLDTHDKIDKLYHALLDPTGSIRALLDTIKQGGSLTDPSVKALVDHLNAIFK